MAITSALLRFGAPPPRMFSSSPLDPPVALTFTGPSGLDHPVRGLATSNRGKIYLVAPPSGDLQISRIRPPALIQACMSTKNGERISPKTRILRAKPWLVSRIRNRAMADMSGAEGQTLSWPSRILVLESSRSSVASSHAKLPVFPFMWLVLTMRTLMYWVFIHTNSGFLAWFGSCTGFAFYFFNYYSIYSVCYMALANHRTSLRGVLVWYWFSEDFLTQSNPFCTSIISSNQNTRAHSDNIIIKNGHFSQRRTYIGWCKCHDEFRIATSSEPFFHLF